MDVPFSLLLELVGIQYIENKEKELLDLTDSKNEPGVNIANKWLLKSEIFTGAEVKKADQKAKEDKLWIKKHTFIVYRTIWGRYLR